MKKYFLSRLEQFPPEAGKKQKFDHNASPADVFPTIRVPHRVFVRPVDAAETSPGKILGIWSSTNDDSKASRSSTTQSLQSLSSEFLPKTKSLEAIADELPRPKTMGLESIVKRGDGPYELKVLGKNYRRNSDEKHGSSSTRSGKRISKIKKWRMEYISYFAKRGSSGNLGKNQGGGLMPGERNRVTELLRRFRAICRDLLQENNRKRKVDETLRIDFLAARQVKNMRSLYIERTNTPGPVPGIEIGDKFIYRMELNLVGLHRNLQKGIDFVCNGAGERIATSVVASGGYANETSDPNVLIYCGEGGNVVSGIQHEDQSLKNPGNYALKNSIKVRNPVRVIRGTKERRPSFSLDPLPRAAYVYDGLYKVVDFWRDTSCNGKLLYKFKLVRITES